MLDAILKELYKKRHGGQEHSLTIMRELSQALNFPEKTLRFIHIAGTNGKGSVAAMCASILKEQGLRTALFTSPHLHRYNERFQINGEQITDQELEEGLSLIMPLVKDAHFFEITTACALWWFRKKQVDIVVFETGIGGALDPTNIVTPVLSMITPIGLDHMNYLGDTLALIAKQKAGIIKEGVPSVSVNQAPEIIHEIEDRARKVGSALRIVSAEDLDEFVAPLSGDHQRWNTALAVAAVRVLIPNISNTIIKQGLQNTIWPGRCQLFMQEKGLPEVLVDAAHNSHGARALAREILDRYGKNQVTLILGVLFEKNAKEMGEILGAVAHDVILTLVASDRSCSLERLSAEIPAEYAFTSLREALAQANQLGRPIVIAGSTYLVAEALQLL